MFLSLIFTAFNSTNNRKRGFKVSPPPYINIPLQQQTELSQILELYQWQIMTLCMAFRDTCYK